jgi:7,8-dihydro-6-hydroxymethylpterin-pyrophosphokinase
MADVAAGEKLEQTRRDMATGKDSERREERREKATKREIDLHLIAMSSSSHHDAPLIMMHRNIHHLLLPLQPSRHIHQLR